MTQANNVIELMQQGRIEEAQALCERACRENPGDPQTWFMLAGIHAQCGRLPAVVDCCRKVLELQPSTPAALYNLGVALQNLGRNSEAVDAYQRLLALQPDMPAAYANLSLALRATGQLNPAEQAVRQALRLAPQSAETYNNLGLILKDLQRIDEASAAFQHALQLKPALAQAHYNLGLCRSLQKRHSEAETAFREALRLQPSYPEAWNDLGATQHAQARYDEAMQAYRQALQLQPQFAEALNNLGLSFLETERLDLAEQQFRAALAANPEYVQALNNLGNLFTKQGRLDIAVEHYQRALKAQPDYADGHNNLGLALEQAGQFEAAVDSFRRAIRSQPTHADAHNNLGVSLMRLSRFSDAVAALRKAITLKDDFAAAYNNLGNALLCEDNFRDNCPEAERAYSKAVEFAPELAEAHFNLGTCLQQQGKHEEALQCFGRAQELRPGYIDAIAGQATALEHKGDFDEGMRLIQPHIDAGTNNIHIALAFGALSRHCDRREQAIVLLEGQVTDPTILSRDRIKAHFTLGKLYDELKEYGKSFEHYRAANDLDLNRFDRRKNEQLFDNIIARFPAEEQTKRPRATNRSRKPVFIVGMPRSGTSLVEQILASHPQVHGAGELDDINKLTAELPGHLGTALPFLDCIHMINRKALDALAKKHLDRLTRLNPSAIRITDKMPHNFQNLGLIELMFPGAQIIHCMRNPIDTCISIYFQHFNAHHAYANDLTELGMYYRQYLRLMAHWRKTLTIPMLEVQYEDLVDDQETLSRRMIEFCGLEWDDACLEFHKSKRTVTTPSYDQVRRPIYRKSVERWRKYESHIAPLIEALGIDISRDISTAQADNHDPTCADQIP